MSKRRRRPCQRPPVPLPPLAALVAIVPQESGDAWEQQLKMRRALLEDRDCGCLVWDDSAAAVAEEVLAMMAMWLPR